MNALLRIASLAFLGMALIPAGCARGPSNADLAPAPGQIRPIPRPGTIALPGAGAVTAEQFDTNRIVASIIIAVNKARLGGGIAKAAGV